MRFMRGILRRIPQPGRPWKRRACHAMCGSRSIASPRWVTLRRAKLRGAGLMTITLNSEQVLISAIQAGLAHTPDEALDRALDLLRERVPKNVESETTVARAARRLGTLGKRH